MAKNATLEKLPLWKISKIVATRCQILSLKCTKLDFGWGSALDPARGVYSAPQTPYLDFKGPTSKKMEGERGEKGKRKGGESRGDEWRGERGRRRMPPFLISEYTTV